MIKVKEFFETFSNTGRNNDLDRQINAFLENDNVEFVDIKYLNIMYNSELFSNNMSYHTSGTSALLVYRIKSEV